MISATRWDNAPITAPGWYDGVPLTVYHSNKITIEPSVSSSGLRMLWQKSPKHFAASWSYTTTTNGDEDEPDEEKKWMTLGRAAHHLFLGEDNFSLDFIERPDRIAGLDWNGNRNDCKAFLRQQREAGRTVITPKDVKTIRGMSRSIQDDSLAVDLLQGAVEQTLIARDAETGLWLRARPDVITSSDGMHADFKTTASVLDLDLKRTLRNWGYNQQGALLWEVCELLGLPFEGFVLVFAEKKPPYCTRIIELTDDDLSRGRMQNRAMIRLIAQCLASGMWPGPGNHDAEFFSIPQAEQEWIDKRLAAMEA